MTYGPFDRPKPRLDRDPDAPSTYRPTFEMRNVTGLWAHVFNEGAGGHGWPVSLPAPRVEQSRIEVRGLAHGQIQKYIELLRERVASTNSEIARQLPELEARREQDETDMRHREEELEAAQRAIDDMFD